MAALALLAACGGDGGPSRPTNSAAWEVGPVIDGKNYSVGVPPRPSVHPEGWAIDIPIVGNVNYLTFRHGSLAGKSRIVMRYRVEMAEGVEILPKCCPDLPSIGPTIYFQVAGDDWNTDGDRWWATFNAPSPMVSGEHEVSVSLVGKWTSVSRITAETDPDRFKGSLVRADRVGFTLGGGNGYGHGVYATGPARLIVTGFDVV